MPQIEEKQIFKGEIFENQIKSAKELLEELDKLIVGFKTIGKQAKESLKGFKDTSASVSNFEVLTKKVAEQEKQIKLLTATKKEQNTLNLATIKLEQQLEAVKKGEKDATFKLTNELQRETKARKEVLGIGVKELTAFQKLTNARNKAQIELKNGIVLYGETSKRVAVLQRSFDNLDRAYARINRSARDGRPDVGRYGLATQGLGKNLLGLGKNLIGGLGIVAGVQMFSAILLDAFNTIKDFEKTIDTLQAVSSASNTEMKSLKATILDLGKETKFTTKEVAEASIELAKLGFTSFEIEKSLKGILVGSVALGSQVPETAELVSKTIRAFGLTAGDTDRVVSTLAVSANKTATSFQYFADSLPYASTGAKQLGFSVEQTATFLGVLADNGIQASSAGVSLRDIFADLSVKGLTMNEALDKIKKSTDKNKTAFELFGKTSMNSAIILADNKDKFEALTASITGQEEALKKLSEIRSDNLAGDIDKMKGSWEAFILSLDSGDGVVSRVFRSITQLINGVIEQFIELNETQKDRDRKVEKKATANSYDVTKKQIASITDEMKKQGSTEKEIYDRKIRYINFLKETESKYFTSQNDLIIRNNVIINKLKEGLGGKYLYNDEDRANVKRIETLKKESLYARDRAVFSKGQLAGYNQLFAELTKQKEVKTEIADADAEELKSAKEKVKEQEKLVGLIEIQEKKVSDLEKKFSKEKTEKGISETNKILDKERIELERLRNLGKEKEAIITDQFQIDLDNLELKNKKEILAIKEKNTSVEQTEYELYLQQEKILKDKIELFKTYKKEVVDIETELYDLRKSQLNKEIEDQTQRDLQTGEEYKAKKEAERLQTIKSAQELNELLTSFDQERSKKRLENIDRELQASERERDRLKELAESKSIDSSKAIADEDRKIEQANQKKEKQQRADERRQSILLLSNLILKASEDPNDKTPVLTGLKNWGLSESAKLLVKGSFFDGTDDVGATEKKAFNTGKDDYLARLDKGEMVFNSKQSSLLRSNGFDTRKKIIQAVLQQKQMPINESKNLEIGQNIIDRNNELIAELKKLPSKMPTTDTNYNAFYKAIEETRKVGNAKETRRKHLKL